MNNYPSSAGFVMVMDTLPDPARKKVKKKLLKKREMNGFKFKKINQQSKEIKKRNKKENWGQATTPLDRKNMEKL